MPNQGDEAVDGSPADLPCLEKLDSPSGTRPYCGGLVFKHVRACLMEWIITSIPALIICCRVCFACDVREPAHCLIIQSDGAAQLCLQPEPRTRDHCERGLLLQTDDPFRGQARKTINDSHFLSTPVLKMHQDFNLFFTRICFFCLPPVWRAEWRRLFTRCSGTFFKSSSPVILQTMITLSSCSRKSRQWVCRGNRFKLLVTGKEEFWLFILLNFNDFIGCSWSNKLHFSPSVLSV